MYITISSSACPDPAHLAVNGHGWMQSQALGDDSLRVR